MRCALMLGEDQRDAADDAEAEAELGRSRSCSICLILEVSFL